MSFSDILTSSAAYNRGSRATKTSNFTMRETSHPRLNFVQNFVVAGTSASISRAFVNAFSVSKICTQAGIPGHKMGILQSLFWIYRLEGFGGYLKGLPVGVAKSFVHVGLQFGVYSSLAKRFVPELPLSKAPQLNTSIAIYFCGGYAGAMATVFTHPLDLVKTRLVCQSGAPYTYTSTVDCFTKILKLDGVTGLYRGFAPALIGSFVFSGQLFMLWDLGQRVPWMRRQAPFLPFEWFLWSCLAVGGASVIAQPFDVWRRKMMAYHVSLPKHGRVDLNASTTFGTFLNIYSKNGLFGYFHGTLANMFKVAPQLMVFVLSFKVFQSGMLSISGGNK